MSETPPVLEVENLRVSFGRNGETPAVRGISFVIPRGRTLALVGESGSGKSATAHAILRLIPPPARIEAGRILVRSAALGEVDLAALPPDSRRLRSVRGGVIGIVFQEPMTALSPVHTIGSQIAEALRWHRDVSATEARRQTVEMLAKVGIGDPSRRFDQYPHEFSGGMRQRVVIAMALICRPELLIADEPTTALDVTVQAQILGLIKSLQRDVGCSVLLITHDFGVVAQMADDVAVMYRGQIVEQGSVRAVLKTPQAAYTQALLAALPGRRTKSVVDLAGALPGDSTVGQGMIQRATLEDAAAIATIHVRAWQAAYAGIIPNDYLVGLSVEKQHEFWHRELLEKRSIVVTAFEKGVLVGWASGGASRDADANGASEIYAVYVSPECWTRGIGAQLMRKIEEDISPCAEVTLWVLAQNQRAIGFYRKLGYEFDGAEKIIQLGSVGLTEVRLRKKMPNSEPLPSAPSRRG